MLLNEFEVYEETEVLRQPLGGTIYGYTSAQREN